MNAYDYIQQYGHRFKIGKTSLDEANKLCQEFKDLGYRSRVTDITGSRRTSEYSISWWQSISQK